MLTVIGLVRNTKYYELREDFKPIAFVPSAQEDDPAPWGTFVLRTNRPLGEFYHAAEGAIAGMHPGFGLDFTVLTTQIKESLMRDRLMAALAGGFGILAGSLAVLGLYGVIAYMVARRKNEIGVRIALGASRGNVIGLVLREAVLLLAVGLAVGLGLAIWAGQAAASLVYGLKPKDPATLAGAAVVVAVVALIAGWTGTGASGCPADALPARRIGPPILRWERCESFVIFLCLRSPTARSLFDQQPAPPPSELEAVVRDRSWHGWLIRARTSAEACGQVHPAGAPGLLRWQRFLQSVCRWPDSGR